MEKAKRLVAAADVLLQGKQRSHHFREGFLSLMFKDPPSTYFDILRLCKEPTGNTPDHQTLSDIILAQTICLPDRFLGWLVIAQPLFDSHVPYSRNSADICFLKGVILGTLKGVEWIAGNEKGLLSEKCQKALEDLVALWVTTRQDHPVSPNETQGTFAWALLADIGGNNTWNNELGKTFKGWAEKSPESVLATLARISSSPRITAYIAGNNLWPISLLGDTILEHLVYGVFGALSPADRLRRLIS